MKTITDYILKCSENRESLLFTFTRVYYITCDVRGDLQILPTNYGVVTITILHGRTTITALTASVSSSS